MLLTLAADYFPNSADVEDAMQELEIKLVPMEGRAPKDQDDLTPWLYAVASNFFKDLYRRQKFRKDLDDSLTSLPEEYIDYNDPLAVLEQAEAVMLMQESFDSMPPTLQSILYDRYELGLSYEEIAEKRDIPLGTVSSRLKRAREHMGKEE